MMAAADEAGDASGSDGSPIMRTSIVFALGLLVALAPAGSSAPAPLQPRDRSANTEIVFYATNAERVRLALIYLRSTSMLDQLAGTTAVSRCLPNGTPAERRAWLLTRLAVQAGDSGSLVTVRVAAGRGEDGL